VATAITFMHRFFAVKSMLSNDRLVRGACCACEGAAERCRLSAATKPSPQIVAQAALFLAGKVEEESAPLEAIVRAAWERVHRPRAGGAEETLRPLREHLQDEARGELGSGHDGREWSAMYKPRTSACCVPLSHVRRSSWTRTR